MMLYLMCKEGVEQQQFTHAHVVSTVCGCNVMVQKIPQSTFQVIFALILPQMPYSITEILVYSFSLWNNHNSQLGGCWTWEWKWICFHSPISACLSSI